MKKIIFVLLALIFLVGCSKETNASNPSKDMARKETSSLEFVLPYESQGKSSELIELGNKLVKEYPDVGAEGEITVYYSGATYRINDTDHAVFMFINRMQETLNKDLEFQMDWSYDGHPIYDKQMVDFKISERIKLPRNSATLLLLPINNEQKEIVDQMTDESKMKLNISDIRVKNSYAADS